MHLPYMLFIIIGIVGIAYCYPAVDNDEMIGILLFFISFHETTFNLVFKFFEDRDDADEFLNEKRSIEAMKRFLYTGKEQRREAKENYEEKCERNVLNKALNKDRWCPELG